MVKKEKEKKIVLHQRNYLRLCIKYSVFSIPSEMVYSKAEDDCLKAHACIIYV